MGCVSSKPDINDQHPNIFQVTNVNDQGKSISSGQLEVTETELVLYQRGKQPTIWPLKSLRKYGFDSGIFSFECGRRCPTGQGIYAFHCRKAEQLFNIVQHHIVLRNSNDDNPTATTLSPNTGDFPIPVVSTGPPVQRRISSNQPPESYLNPTPAPASVVRTHPSLSRPGSITSNGPVSPTITSSPPPLPQQQQQTTPLSEPEHNNNNNNNNNNNKRGSLIPDHQYTNSIVLNEADMLPQASYVNVGGTVTSPTGIVPVEGYMNVVENPCHLYMNIDTNPITKDIQNEPNDDEPKHCYANIDTKDLEHLRPLLLKQSFDTQQLPSVPQTPTALYITVHEVNYAELDLDSSSKNDIILPSTSSQLTTPDSPNNSKKSYATIDFQKTTALSQSINPRMEVEDEGSRKTRHNSTISDVTARHSNSLSD